MKNEMAVHTDVNTCCSERNVCKWENLDVKNFFYFLYIYIYIYIYFFFFFLENDYIHVYTCDIGNFHGSICLH